MTRAAIPDPSAQFVWWIEHALVALAQASTNGKILFREYFAAVGGRAAFSYEEFITKLGEQGYPLQEDGMVGGVMLLEGFVGLVLDNEGDPPPVDGSHTGE